MTTAPTPPFTAHLYLDCYRVLLAAVALWLAVQIVLLGYRRWMDLRRGLHDERTHPLIYASYGLTLFSIGGFRIGGLGEGPNLRLWVATAIVVLGFAGLTKRVRWSLKPPHRRH